MPTQSQRNVAVKIVRFTMIASMLGVVVVAVITTIAANQPPDFAWFVKATATFIGMTIVAILVTTPALSILPTPPARLSEPQAAQGKLRKSKRILFDPDRLDLQAYTTAYGISEVQLYLHLPHDGLMFRCRTILHKEREPIVVFDGKSRRFTADWERRRDVAKDLFLRKEIEPVFTEVGGNPFLKYFLLIKSRGAQEDFIAPKAQRVN